MSGVFQGLASGYWVRLIRRIFLGHFSRKSRKDKSILSDALTVSPASKKAGVKSASDLSEPFIEAPSSPISDKDSLSPLIEMLGGGKLPTVAPFKVENGKAAREQSLAAVNALKQIPSLQSLAQGFVRAASRAEVSVDEVISAIEKDSALCVRVLRMANSAYVMPEQRIDDLNGAIQMLGVLRVRRAAQALVTLRDAQRMAEGLDWRHLWIHAFATAAIAEELEQQLRPNSESVIYLAALLHDVGKIVLSTVAPDEYRQILVAAWNENGRLEDLERGKLGVDHREAGVIFATKNNLPEIAIETIAFHTTPSEAKKYAFEVSLVSLANYFSKAYGLGFSGARLDAADGEFEHQPAWKIIEKELGRPVNIEAVEQGLRAFVPSLRSELQSLREGS